MNRESKIFEKLFIDYSEKVYSLSRFKGLSEQDSQDIVQETFAAVYSSYYSFSEKSSIKTYIVSIARNKIADFYRKKYKLNEAELNEDIGHDSLNNGLIEKTDLTRQIERLTKEQKELLHLIFTQGLNYDEAASVMNIPVGTVKSRMYSIRNILKKRLGETYR